MLDVSGPYYDRMADVCQRAHRSYEHAGREFSQGELAINLRAEAEPESLREAVRQAEARAERAGVIASR